MIDDVRNFFSKYSVDYIQINRQPNKLRNIPSYVVASKLQCG